MSHLTKEIIMTEIDITKIDAILAPESGGALVALTGLNNTTRKALTANFGKPAPSGHLVTIKEAKALLKGRVNTS